MWWRAETCASDRCPVESRHCNNQCRDHPGSREVPSPRSDNIALHPCFLQPGQGGQIPLMSCIPTPSPSLLHVSPTAAHSFPRTPLQGPSDSNEAHQTPKSKIWTHLRRSRHANLFIPTLSASFQIHVASSDAVST
jgi:hypothetical protein